MTSKTTPFSQYSDEPVFNIQAVAEQTDVPALTLRAWERRYDVPKPNRDSQGHRLYSERDIMVIKWLKHQVDNSMRIKQAVKLLNTQVPQHIGITAPAPSLPTLDEALSNRYDALVDELYDAILSFDYPRAQMILTHALSLYSIEDLCLGILIPTFQKIDSAYQSNEITLQQEHFGSNLIRERLLGILTTPATPSRSGRVVVGCAPHEWHEIGALMFSLFLRRRGWEVIYLGQNVGFTGLDETVSQLSPDAFVLSVTHLPNIRYIRETADIVNKSTRGRAIFAYAGRAFAYVPRLIDRMPGLFLGHDLISAVESIEQALNQRWRLPDYEPPQLDAGVEHALHYVEDYRGFMEGAATGVLMRVLDDADSVETSRLAQEIIDVLSVALQYGMPEIMAQLADPHNATLETFGMSPQALVPFAEAMSAIVDEEAPSDAAPTLQAFLYHAAEGLQD